MKPSPNELRSGMTADQVKAAIEAWIDDPANEPRMVGIMICASLEEPVGRRRDAAIFKRVLYAATGIELTVDEILR